VWTGLYILLQHSTWLTTRSCCACCSTALITVAPHWTVARATLVSGLGSLVYVGNAADCFPVARSVPQSQGYVFGSLDFIAKTKDLTAVSEKHRVHSHVYADDTTLWQQHSCRRRVCPRPSDRLYLWRCQAVRLEQTATEPWQDSDHLVWVALQSAILQRIDQSLEIRTSNIQPSSVVCQRYCSSDCRTVVVLLEIRTKAEPSRCILLKYQSVFTLANIIINFIQQFTAGVQQRWTKQNTSLYRFTLQRCQRSNSKTQRNKVTSSQLRDSCKTTT